MIYYHFFKIFYLQIYLQWLVFSLIYSWSVQTDVVMPELISIFIRPLAKIVEYWFSCELSIIKLHSVTCFSVDYYNYPV